MATPELQLAIQNMVIEPLRPDYMWAPTQEGFDWDRIIGDAKWGRDLGGTPLYLVVFRSKLKEGADVALLMEHDEGAHEAAKQSPALIHYFGGLPDEAGQALSFCLWSDREEAKTISKDSRHAAAVKMVAQYESYALEKYYVHHAGGIIEFEPLV